MGRVGLAYSPSFLAHETFPGHPERAERVSAIVSHLQASDVWAQLAVWEPAPATEDTLALVHTPEHIAFIRELSSRGGYVDQDTAVSRTSWEPSLRAVGAVVEAVQQVQRGGLDAAYCVCRPPGHHATPTRPMGFCLLNNIAL